MNIKTEPEQIWQEYQDGIGYNSNINLYDTVEKNENFYVGDQWVGVNAPDLEKPVLNVLKRVCTYFISMLVTDDIGVSFNPFYGQRDELIEQLEDEIDRVIERTKLKSLNRFLLRDACVDGDCAVYFYFDADEGEWGEIKCEEVYNTRIMFGNPYIHEVEAQPFILVKRRGMYEEVKERAAQGDDLRPDDDSEFTEQATNNQKMVTTVVKFWKNDEGQVMMKEIADNGVVVTEETNTMLTLYPVAYMSWEKVKNNYHGRAAITGLIPNQIFVNKMWAMAMQHVKMTSFPKIVYDKTKFLSGWSNKIGEAVGVAGDPATAVNTVTRTAELSAQVLTLVDKTIEYTRDFMGASDAALGNIKPDNTSAIIAVQKASSAPLELQRLAFYQFVEDYVRIIIDIIRHYYGVRVTQDGSAVIDFSAIPYDAMQMNVDVGASAYWSELTRVQTMDNLFEKGIVTDAVTYLESVPDQYVPNKDKIIQQLEEQKQLQQQMQGGVQNGAMPAVQNAAVY